MIVWGKLWALFYLYCCYYFGKTVLTINSDIIDWMNHVKIAVKLNYLNALISDKLL